MSWKWTVAPQEIAQHNPGTPCPAPSSRTKGAEPWRFGHKVSMQWHAMTIKYYKSCFSDGFWDCDDMDNWTWWCFRRFNWLWVDYYDATVFFHLFPILEVTKTGKPPSWGVQNSTNREHHLDSVTDVIYISDLRASRVWLGKTCNYSEIRTVPN